MFAVLQGFLGEIKMRIGGRRDTDGMNIRILKDIFMIRCCLYLRKILLDRFQAVGAKISAHDGARIGQLREDTDMVGAPLVAPDDTDINQSQLPLTPKPCP